MSKFYNFVQFPPHKKYLGVVVYSVSTMCLKNVPTFKLSVTLSNLNRFSKFCTAGKRVKFATKHHYPPHLKHVATLILKIQIICKYLTDMEK